MEKFIIITMMLLRSQSEAQELPCDFTTESSRRLVPYISGPISTVSHVADLVSCQRECVESSSFICAAVNYNSVSRSCQLLEENDQTATPAPASSWQYSLRPICAGLWQPWTATKGKYLDTGVTKFDSQNTEDLKSCMTRCIQDNVNTTTTDYRCRSVVKSIVSPGVCHLVDKRSDDTGIMSEANTEYQYFDRPHWYTDSAPGSTNSDIEEYNPRGQTPTIFTGQKIESDGYIVAWQYYIGQTNNYCDSYAGVWRQEGNTNTYTLIMETLLSPIDTSSRGVRFQFITDQAVSVKKDDVISTHVRNIPENGCSGTLVSFTSQAGSSRYGIPSDIEDVGVGDSWATTYSENRKAALRPFIAEYLITSSISVSYGDSVGDNQVKLSWGEPAGLSNQSIAGGGYQIECFESRSGANMGCTSEFVEASGEKDIILQLESTDKVYHARVQVVRNVNGQKVVDDTHQNSTEFCAKRGMLQSGEVNITETGLLQPGEERTLLVEIPSLKDNDPCLTSVTINNVNTGRTAEHSFVMNQGEVISISVSVERTGGFSQVLWAGDDYQIKQGNSDSFPPSPEGLSVSSRLQTTVVLEWELINGYTDEDITNYQVSCSVINDTFHINDEPISKTEVNYITSSRTNTWLTADQLHPQVQYSCQVKALLKHGRYGHPSGPTLYWTKPSYLPTEVDSGQVTIKLPSNADQKLEERFNKVVIVVSKVHDWNRSRRSLTVLPIDGMNTYKTAEFLLRDSNETFTIGDGHRYGGYDNKKLDIGSFQFYVAYQAVTEQDVEQFYQITKQPIRVEYPTEPPPTTTADGATGEMSSVVTPIVAAAAGVIVVTIFVIGGVVIYRRRKSHSNDSDEYDDAMATNVGNHTRGPQTPAADIVVLSSLLAEESHAYEEIASSVQGFHDTAKTHSHIYTWFS